MSYHFSKTVGLSFEEAVKLVTDRLADEGFGILTEIDVKATLKKKLNVEVPEYRILGACNPPFAHQALQVEERIGLMMPCNVIVRKQASGAVEVAAIDPQASMQAIHNSQLADLAGDVRDKLQKVVEGLPGI